MCLGEAGQGAQEGRQDSERQPGARVLACIPPSARRAQRARALPHPQPLPQRTAIPPEGSGPEQEGGEPPILYIFIT